jgi:hypothetical protein
MLIKLVCVELSYVFVNKVGGVYITRKEFVGVVLPQECKRGSVDS